MGEKRFDLKVKNINNFNGQKIFFTADTHFGHENIMSFCKRPFKSIEEHDKALVDNWNSVVGSKDIVFHLGDFAFGDRKFVSKIVSQLNGKIWLILGNHDYKNISKSMDELFWKVSNQTLIQINGQQILLNHYPFLCYAGVYSKTPTWQLYGHVHTGPKSIGKDDQRVYELTFPMQYDVGVDNNEYAPISFEKIAEKIEHQLQLTSGDFYDDNDYFQYRWR